MKIQYQKKRFHKATLQQIDQANAILSEYKGEGFTLTLRQLYYQFVARDLIPNEQKSYDRLGETVKNARLAGLISWTAIEDRNRSSYGPWIQGDIEAVMSGLAEGYAPDLWEDQDNYVEVWVEKDALSNVVERPCNRWDVRYLACRGYVSASEQWRASNRFRTAERSGKRCFLIHLGDHDPSGIDMTRDNAVRLDVFRADVEVRRIALNFDQIEEHKPPPNPAKITDSRYGQYVARFGPTSWELDALPPRVIEQLVEAEIVKIVDVDLMEEKREQRDDERAVFHWIEENAGSVIAHAREAMEGDDNGY